MGRRHLRRFKPLARIGTAFDSLAHTVDVRRIEIGRGRFNIPNSRHLALARRGLSPQLGTTARWATRWPRDEFTHLADPVHAPDPITPRVLVGHTGIYYGTGGSPVTTADNLDPSIVLYVDGDDSHLPRQVDPDCVNIANSYAVLTASDPIHGRSVNDAPHKLLLFPIKRGSCLGRHKKCRSRA